MATVPARIVDLHTHLFNARCLPLAGIIANAMDKDAGDSRFSQLLARILNALCSPESSARSFHDSRAYRYRLTSRYAVLDDFEDLLESVLHSQVSFNQDPRLLTDPVYRQSLESDRVQRLKGSELYGTLQDLDKELMLQAQAPPTPLFGQTIADHVGWARRVFRRALEWLDAEIKKTGLLVDEIDDYLTFFFRLLQSEHSLATTVLHEYGPGLPPLQVVHHLMDMQMAYVTANTPPATVAPRYDFLTVQLEQMADLQSLPEFSGIIKGFAAFDPRRQYRGGIPAFVESAGHVFLGFKFYCAMGYLPICNSDHATEAAVDEFFATCESLGIPVFTHCTPVGFETRAKLGLNANPDNWTARLKRNPRLRLCFAHGGGQAMEHRKPDPHRSIDWRSPGWTAATPTAWSHKDNFAYKVVKLCTTNESVYCDLACFPELMDGAPSSQAAAIAHLKANLIRASAEPGPTKFMERVCYGSDWHMPSMTRHARRYLDVMMDIFSDSSPSFAPVSSHREEYFWQNAYRFLGMG